MLEQGLDSFQIKMSLLNWQAILTCFIIVIIKIYNSFSSMFTTFS